MASRGREAGESWKDQERPERPRPPKPKRRHRGHRSFLSEQAREEIFMTVQQVAEYLGCHPVTVYRLVQQRKIPVFKLGGSWRFLRSDIDQWIRDRQVRPEARGGREDKGRGRRRKAGR
jgi:excisionase family DNA binding protein